MRRTTSSSNSSANAAGMERSALKLKQPRCPALRLWVTKELPQIIAVISGRMIWRTLGFFIVAS